MGNAAAFLNWHDSRSSAMLHLLKTVENIPPLMICNGGQHGKGLQPGNKGRGVTDLGAPRQADGCSRQLLLRQLLFPGHIPHHQQVV